MTKVLKTTDRVRLNTWTFQTASIGNIWEAYGKHAEWIAAMGAKGHPIPEGSDLTMAEYVARNRKNGGEDVWAISAGTCISSNPAFYEEAKREFANAVVIENGEVVEYCGRKWKMTSTGRRYLRKEQVETSPEFANPFRFELVVEEKATA
jgi:hypothetical protein